MVTAVNLSIDPGGNVTTASAVNHIVTQNVAPDAAASAILAKYTALSAPLANKVVGEITADILSARGTPNGQNAAGEQPMGDVIADAMLEATAPTDFGGAVAAFMNAGGVRASLLFARSPGGEPPGAVTYGEAFDVQPFGNTLVVKTCTGQQLYDVLNQQFNNPSVGSNRIMLPSANVDYHWTTVGGPHVVDGTLSFDKRNDVRDQGGELPGRAEQLHRGRRRRVHRVQVVHRAARRRGRPRRVRALPRVAGAPAARPAGARSDPQGRIVDSSSKDRRPG